MIRILIALFFVSMYATAQKPCAYDYEINNDSTYYKETKKILIYENEFGKKSNYAFVSLVNDSGYTMLNIQRVQKSDSFIETECLDKDSRIFLQLTNGKIYTLTHLNQEVCSSRYPDMGNNLNIRVLNSSFFFMKDDFEDLKKYPISIMRIRYGFGDQITYVMEKELVSKSLETSSNPATIFMDYFNCIE